MVKKTNTGLPILCLMAFLLVPACSLFTRAAGALENVTGGAGGQSATPGTGGASGTGESAATPQAGVVSDLTEGLEGLQSYRASFTLTVDGRDEQGNKAAGRLEMLHEVNRPAGQDHVRYSFEGVYRAESPAGALDTFETYQDNGTTYILTGNGQDRDCTAYPAGGEEGITSVIMSADELVASVENPRLEKQGDEVNGIPADRYSFKGASFYFGDMGRSTGKYWLAADGGYVARFTADARGKGSMFGASVDGTYSLVYDVTSANAGLPISLPGECSPRPLPQDLPLPADAANAENFSGTVSFETGLSPEEAADFFRTNMAARGWTAGEEKTIQAMILLLFSRESRSLSIMITAGGAGLTSVLITPSQ